MHRLFMVIFGMLGLFAVGCGSEQVAVWPTSGKVVFTDGSPVTMGLIEFTPVEGGPAARAKINPDGTFSLKTVERNGAVAGLHRVAVVHVIGSDAVAHQPPLHHRFKRVHPKFARPQTSGLTREVLARNDNDVRIEVDPATPASGWNDRAGRER